MNRLPKIIILKGLPGSGKSTWSKEMCEKDENYTRISKDDIRKEIRERKGLDYWVRVDEKEVLEIRDILIAASIEQGKNVIVDDTNLNPAHERMIKEKFEGRAKIEIKKFNISLEECIRRDSLRPQEKRVGEKVIKDMYKRYMSPFKKQVIEWNDKLPFIYLCDIDGTVADNVGRSPFDMTRVLEDEPIREVVKTIKTLRNSFEIIFFSGRNECARADTEKWLGKHLGIDEGNIKLFMRADNDMRKDSVVKYELYEKYIKGKYNVIAVFDDRNQVVEMWREIGLKCFQTQEGDF